MKDNIIFSIHYHHPDGEPQYFTIYENGTMVCSGERIYQLQPKTVSRLRSKVKKAARKLAFSPAQIDGWQYEWITEIQCYSRIIKINPFSKEKKEFNTDRYSKVIYKLKFELYRILDSEEPMFISCTNGVYMLDRTRDSKPQIQAICDELRSTNDTELKYCLFVFLLTALYWSDIEVYFLATNGQPRSIDSRFYFNLEQDICDKRGYEVLPFRKLLYLLMDRYGEVKLGYQPALEYFWSTDAIRDCFFYCKTL